MAALSEKVLWPIVAIFIFGVLAGFYIDDRRSLMENGDSTNQKQASSSEHGGDTAEQKQANNEHGDQEAENKAAEEKPSTAASSSGSSSDSSGNQAAKATSLDLNEYLAQSSNERSAELEANVTHHQGFTGSIDEYLTGAKPKAKNKMQAKTNNSSTHSQQAEGASSMSMEEYQAKTSGGSNNNTQPASTNSGAYHGGIDEYLAKYGNGAQTPVKKNSADPFDDKEHVGFHGSYEDYAEKYN